MRKIAKTLFAHNFYFCDRVVKAENVSWELPEKDPAKMDTTLLPCPCCGSDDLYYFWYKHQNGRERTGICCVDCMLRMDNGTDAMTYQARMRWNRRANKNETKE